MLGCEVKDIARQYARDHGVDGVVFNCSRQLDCTGEGGCGYLGVGDSLEGADDQDLAQEVVLKRLEGQQTVRQFIGRLKKTVGLIDARNGVKPDA